MRRAIWPAVAFVLMIVSFAVGRVTGGFHSLPDIAATLPGDESQFAREMDERIRERFPIGTSEDKLVDYLAGEGFVPEWRRRDAANASMFVWSGLLCKKTVRALWRADAAGVLTDVNGAYESQCLR
jgi:hypothetical protein